MDVDELELLQEERDELPVRYLPKVLNGGISGIVGVSCVFPMDLVKTRLQNQKGTTAYSGIVDCFKKSWRAGAPGKLNQVKGMYQGASVNIFLITPEKAIKLVANDFFRHSLMKDQAERLSTPRGMVAGAAAGFCQVVITTPMELLKIRMQQSPDKVKATRLIWNLLTKDGGVRALYRGLGPTMARDVSFSALYFPLFAYLDGLGPRKKDDSGDAVFWASFVSGLTAGASASFAVTPLDVVKTRIQSGGSNYNGICHAFYRIWMDEGVKALFKGAICRMMVMAPLFGIAQTVYYVGLAEKILGLEKGSRV
ncbi:Protein CBG05880 [Caenorhabditis briggsae]|uniref:Uncharacterized protein n=2 Tax=Caenorhabditis briggsae TaxID=6238 RepID=A0AAE9EU38_CAEBR|nr:Protein CBG05880 [Caenorhabditis briggsae]ULT95118.1 hypothetical protein L3Y34_004092 [Caenorhabditis briggsae]UMM28323.1 hypothetical protein L5515_011216 [Caenorhabditis briggsae]CAP26465.1 Protein CBG05880 [Caenorhabditis briggsae]